MIKNIRVVKSYGWQSAFLDKIFSSRAAEIALLRIVALLRGLITMILQATPVMVALCTFALHTYTADEPLTAVQVCSLCLCLRLVVGKNEGDWSECRFRGEKRSLGRVL